MRRLLSYLGIMVFLMQSASAWQPGGWVYTDWPWAYEAAYGSWHWLKTDDTQWVYGYAPANGWRRIGASGLNSGWLYYAWPFAYSQTQSSWYYVNEADTQWTVAMQSGTWSVFGRAVQRNPLFDLEDIERRQLDALILQRIEDDGLVIEEIEYTAEIINGQPVRIRGTLAYPAGGRDLPAVFWSQPGMLPASDYWPRIWAARGYVCFNITLPHDRYDSFARFTTEQPAQGNLARLARAQMCGITYMSQRPEVDSSRMGISGISYGGLFAAMIAGVDPRIKCGLSFFVTGNHRLGSSFPQFTNLDSPGAIDIWEDTIDSARYLRQRAVPFLFAVASNDPWMHLPAAIKTYQDAIGEKRLAIAPNWSHVFPDGIDQMLIDWFDIHLAQTRAPYNQPSALELSIDDRQLTARWQWDGGNAVTTAELVVAYGGTRPWHDGWPNRYHHAIPAIINGNTATAVIPRPDPDIECLIYGNITDASGALVSTLPVNINASTWQSTRISPLTLNTARVSDFSTAELDFFERHGQRLHGEPDASNSLSGTQSLRVRTPAGTSPSAVVIQLGHIPGRSHRLTVWIKAEETTDITVSVTAIAPPNLSLPIVQHLRREYAGDAASSPSEDPLPTFRITSRIGSDWQAVELNCPFNGESLDGYSLNILESGGVTYWIDNLTFEPLFNE